MREKDEPLPSRKEAKLETQKRMAIVQRLKPVLEGFAECAIRGCYLIYQKDKGLPIYIGSNRKQKRNVRGRIRSIFYGRGHPLPYKIVKDLFYKKSKIKITTREVKKNLESYRKWCLKNLSFKIVEERKRPLAMEIGLIYLFRPKYNSESRKFLD